MNLSYVIILLACLGCGHGVVVTTTQQFYKAFSDSLVSTIYLPDSLVINGSEWGVAGSLPKRSSLTIKAVQERLEASIYVLLDFNHLKNLFSLLPGSTLRFVGLELRNHFDLLGYTFLPLRLSPNTSLRFDSCLLHRRVGLPPVDAVLNLLATDRPAGSPGGPVQRCSVAANVSCASTAEVPGAVEQRSAVFLDDVWAVVPPDSSMAFKGYLYGGYTHYAVHSYDVSDYYLSEACLAMRSSAECAVLLLQQLKDQGPGGGASGSRGGGLSAALIALIVVCSVVAVVAVAAILVVFIYRRRARRTTVGTIAKDGGLPTSVATPWYGDVDVRNGHGTVTESARLMGRQLRPPPRPSGAQTQSSTGGKLLRLCSDGSASDPLASSQPPASSGCLAVRLPAPALALLMVAPPPLTPDPECDSKAPTAVGPKDADAGDVPASASATVEEAEGCAVAAAAVAAAGFGASLTADGTTDPGCRTMCHALEWKESGDCMFMGLEANQQPPDWAPAAPSFAETRLNRRRTMPFAMEAVTPLARQRGPSLGSPKSLSLRMLALPKAAAAALGAADVSTSSPGHSISSGGSPAGVRRQLPSLSAGVPERMQRRSSDTGRADAGGGFVAVSSGQRDSSKRSSHSSNGGGSGGNSGSGNSEGSMCGCQEDFGSVELSAPSMTITRLSPRSAAIATKAAREVAAMVTTNGTATAAAAAAAVVQDLDTVPSVAAVGADWLAAAAAATAGSPSAACTARVVAAAGSGSLLLPRRPQVITIASFKAGPLDDVSTNSAIRDVAYDMMDTPPLSRVPMSYDIDGATTQGSVSPAPTPRGAARLRLDEVLGSGSHGTVYKGMWQGRDVAVKTLVFSATSAHDDTRRRAIREATLSAAVSSHPNIVSIYSTEVEPLPGGCWAGGKAAGTTAAAGAIPAVNCPSPISFTGPNDRGPGGGSGGSRCFSAIGSRSGTSPRGTGDLGRGSGIRFNAVGSSSARGPGDLGSRRNQDLGGGSIRRFNDVGSRSAGRFGTRGGCCSKAEMMDRKGARSGADTGSGSEAGGVAGGPLTVSRRILSANGVDGGAVGSVAGGRLGGDSNGRLAPGGDLTRGETARSGDSSGILADVGPRHGRRSEDPAIQKNSDPGGQDVNDPAGQHLRSLASRGSNDPPGQDSTDPAGRGLNNSTSTRHSRSLAARGSNDPPGHDAGGVDAGEGSAAGGGEGLEDECSAVMDWRMYIIQEYADAGTLLQLYGDPDLWPGPGEPILPAVVSLALGVARALTHLHSKRIIHGDLNPSNVLLKRDPGEPSGFAIKVGDFGLSIFLPQNRSHVSNLRVGTMFYVCPAVVMKAQVGPASDVFSLGVMLWELFHGCPAGTNTDEGPRYNARFPAFPPTCPEPYRVIAVRCLQRQPQNRPTAAEVATSLEHLQASLSAPTDCRSDRHS